jgi:hypothetical protein
MCKGVFKNPEFLIKTEQNEVRTKNIDAAYAGYVRRYFL